MLAVLISIPILLGVIAGLVYLLNGGTISLGPTGIALAIIAVLSLLGQAANILLNRELEGVNIPSDTNDDDLPPKDRIDPKPTPPGGVTLSKAKRKQMFWDAVSQVVDNAEKVKVER